MGEKHFSEILSSLKGRNVTVHIMGGLKVAGILEEVESAPMTINRCSPYEKKRVLPRSNFVGADYLVVEEKFLVPMASIAYIAKSVATF